MTHTTKWPDCLRWIHSPPYLLLAVPLEAVLSGHEQALLVWCLFLPFGDWRDGGELENLFLVIVIVLLAGVWKWLSFFLSFFSFFFLLHFRAPEAYGGSQGLNRSCSLGLGRSHSSTGSEPCLRPSPQLKAMPDP